MKTNQSLDDLDNNDLLAYNEMLQFFQNTQISRSNESHSYVFRRELSRVTQYIDRRPEDKEKRAIAVGFAAYGSMICVNTKNLKQLLSRCKSSVNNGFLQLGYISIKTKSKAQACLATILPPLGNTIAGRKWSVRYHVSQPIRSVSVPIIHYQLPIVKNEPKPQSYVIPMIQVSNSNVSKHDEAIVDDISQGFYEDAFNRDDLDLGFEF